MAFNETPTIKEKPMNIKRELIALAVRVLADNTNLVRKPEPFEELITNLFGGETYDQRTARVIDEESAKALEAAKRFNTNRKFKKITKNV